MATYKTFYFTVVINLQRTHSNLHYVSDGVTAVQYLGGQKLT